MSESTSQPRVAIIIPCHNEEATIADVVRAFRKALPAAAIHVCDNNSSDNTTREAAAAGAIVHSEHRQGKGNAVRRMFADVEADAYVLVDGDATYHAPSAVEMLQKLADESLDMVVGQRMATEGAYRCGHRLGNRLLTGVVTTLFRGSIADMLSGLRVLSRRFVKSFPIFSQGFEIETELTIHCLELRLPYGEVQTPYKARPEGSFSKLRTYRDGFRILRVILKLLLLERSMLVFGLLGLLCLLFSLALAVPLHLADSPAWPLQAVLCLGSAALAAGALAVGYLMSGIRRARLEMKHLAYLGIPACRRENGK